MIDREDEIKQEGNQNSNGSTPVIVIVILVIIGLVGAYAIFNFATLALGGIQTDSNFDTSSNNEATGNYTEKIGKHDFKIPEGYEKQDSTNEANGGITVSFRNPDIKFLYISDLNQRLNLEDFAREYGKELGNDGVKVDINGEPAYRFEINSMGYVFYSYAMNINGDTYTFLINKDTPNPNDFIASLL